MRDYSDFCIALDSRLDLGRSAFDAVAGNSAPGGDLPVFGFDVSLGSGRAGSRSVVTSLLFWVSKRLTSFGPW